MPALAALLCSTLWGIADFGGGVLSRRHATLAVILTSQGGSLLALLPVAALATPPLGGYVWWGVAVGCSGGIALTAFYRALADGRMSVVAPIAGTGVAVPVVVALAGGERPGTVALLGILLAVLGVVLASGPELHGGLGNRRSVGLAIVSAVGFGLTLTFLAEGGETDVLGTILAARLTTTALYLAAAAVLRARPVLRTDRLAALGLGGCDLVAIGLYTWASRATYVSVVAVLASLYPVVTVLLARRFHAETLRPVQAVGVAGALIGVALLASAGT